MKAIIILAAAFACAGCASVPQSEVTPAPVIAAEHAFAARAGEIGWIPAFCEYSADGAQLVGRAGLIDAKARMCGAPENGGTDLYWAPDFAGIARSGDMGFTTGPASFDATRTPTVQYFTVWVRQADGAWRWIYDGGPGPVASPGPYLQDGQAVRALPVATHGAGSAASAVEQVLALEREPGTPASLRASLAEDAHVYRRGQPRVFGGEQARDAMAYPVENVAYRVVRAEGSSAGDMVFTLGEARWENAGVAAQGFFARIWQLRPEGWRIVYDQLVPWSPPPS